MARLLASFYTVCGGSCLHQCWQLAAYACSGFDRIKSLEAELQLLRQENQDASAELQRLQVCCPSMQSNVFQLITMQLEHLQ